MGGNAALRGNAAADYLAAGAVYYRVDTEETAAAAAAAAAATIAEPFQHVQVREPERAQLERQRRRRSAYRPARDRQCDSLSSRQPRASRSYT